MAGESV